MYTKQRLFFKPVIFISGLLLSSLTLADDASQDLAYPGFNALPGYIQQDSSLQYVPFSASPPKVGSAGFTRDELVHNELHGYENTIRYAQAAKDAEITFPAPAKSFSCAVGVDINEKDTPKLYKLMQRTFSDFGYATSLAKKSYNRTRPFVYYSENTCKQDMEDLLRKDGSWPSGHSAGGWGWGLILAEVNPARAAEIIARGRSFGQSRVICNAHWQSDVDEGRLVGAAAVAVLHTSSDFISDLEAAKQEVAAAIKSGKTPTEDCKAENFALSLP